MKGSAGEQMAENNRSKATSSVKKAVIPAAGLGTRFLPATKVQPKEMLPVVDKPVIQYVVEEAVASGIDDILIVTGRGKRSIEDHFDTSFELEAHLEEKKNHGLLREIRTLSDMADIHFIRQKHPKGLGDAILRAEKHCDGEPFAVLLGDTITIPLPGQEECTAQMVKAFEQFGSTIVVIEEVPRDKIRDYGIIDGDPISNSAYAIADIIEKPSPETAPSNLGATGRYVLTPNIFDILKDTPPGYNGEVQLTDALRKVPNPIGLVTACTRYDIGDKIGWLKAIIELALERDEFSDELTMFMKNLLGDR